MHIRINDVTVSPTRVDELAEVLSNKAQPVVLGLQGCKGLLCAADRATGSCAIVSLWDSRESLDASEQALVSIRSETVDAVEAHLDNVSIAEILREIRVRPTEVGSRSRVVRLRAQADTADQLVDFYRDVAVPRLQGQPGFLSSRLIRYVDDLSSFAAVSHWADAASLEASEGSSAPLRDEVSQAVPGTTIERVSTAEIILAELLP